MRIISLCLILIVTTAGCQTTRGDRSCSFGLLMHSKHQYEEARENYDRCLDKADLTIGVRARTHLMRGYALLRVKNKDWDAAETDIQTALDLGVLTENNKANAYLHLGIINRKKEKYDAAIRFADKAIELKPDTYNGYYSRAQTHYRADNLDEAIADYSKAIELSPERSTLFKRRAYAFIEKGDLDAGLKDFQKAIDLNTKPETLYLNRSLQYVYHQKFELALEDQKKIRRIDPGGWIVNWAAGVQLMWMRQYPEAIHMFNKLPQTVFDVAALKDRGIALMQQGHYADAVGDLKKALKKAKHQYAALWLYVAEFKTGIDGQKKLREFYNPSVKTKGWPRPIFQFLLGELTEAEFITEARHRYSAIEKRRMCQAKYFVGVTALFKGQKERAKKFLKESADTPSPYCFEATIAKVELKKITKKSPTI